VDIHQPLLGVEILSTNSWELHRRRTVLESLSVGVAVVSESGGLQPAGQFAIDILGTATSDVIRTDSLLKGRKLIAT
jgi:hypothetical protein